MLTLAQLNFFSSGRSMKCRHANPERRTLNHRKHPQLKKARTEDTETRKTFQPLSNPPCELCFALHPPNAEPKTLLLIRSREPAGCLEPVCDVRDDSIDPAVGDVDHQFWKQRGVNELLHDLLFADEYRKIVVL
jgi:hypothetical protein